MALPKDRFIRVNGDDVLFAATPKEYKDWETHTANVGLKKSVGKNYYSRDLAMINSEVYTWSKEQNRLVRVPLPNVGLLGYVGDYFDDEGRQILPSEQLAGILKDFWPTVPVEYRPSALKLIKTRYERVLCSFPGNIFGPRALGNLGLPVHQDVKFTRYQLRYMEAHRTGQFSIWEGVSSAYSAIEKLYQREVALQEPFYRWSVPENELVLVPENVFPDPYSRSGGYSRPLMVMRRWFVPALSAKHSIVFGRRRFNRFLQKHPMLNVLGGSALESVLQGRWSEERWQWNHIRSGSHLGHQEPFTLFF